MKYFLIGLMVFGSITAIAADKKCTNLKLINKAAERAFTKTDAPYAATENARFFGTTSTGKDKWIVPMSVQEECLASVLIYTKKGTCEVLEVMEIGDRDC